VALVRTDVSEEHSAAIIRVTRIGELGKLAVTNIIFLRSVLRLIVIANVPSSPILVPLMMEALLSSERSVLTRPHGVTSQNTPFFIVLKRLNQVICMQIDPNLWENVALILY
jgi:hypothetical protein